MSRKFMFESGVVLFVVIAIVVGARLLSRLDAERKAHEAVTAKQQADKAKADFPASTKAAAEASAKAKIAEDKAAQAEQTSAEAKEAAAEAEKAAKQARMEATSAQLEELTAHAVAEKTRIRAGLKNDEDKEYLALRGERGVTDRQKAMDQTAAACCVLVFLAIVLIAVVGWARRNRW